MSNINIRAAVIRFDSTATFFSNLRLWKRLEGFALSPSCVTCHNAHKHSPRKRSVMGGGVIRILLR